MNTGAIQTLNSMGALFWTINLALFLPQITNRAQNVEAA